MNRVLAQAGAVLLEAQFLAARLPLERVVVVAAFIADEEDRFGFLFALGHARARSVWDGIGVLI